MTSKCICEIPHHVTFASGGRVHSDSAQTSAEEMTERADVSKRIQIEQLPTMTALTIDHGRTREQFVFT